MKIKKDGIYLAINPLQNSGQVVDIRRIWLPREEVKVVAVHRFSIRGRYEVVNRSGKQFTTGRLEKAKRYVQTTPVAF
jgi:hypothetical protein